MGEIVSLKSLPEYILLTEEEDAQHGQRNGVIRRARLLIRISVVVIGSAIPIIYAIIASASSAQCVIIFIGARVVVVGMGVAIIMLRAIIVLM